MLAPDSPPLAAKQFHRTMLVGSQQQQLPGADTANYNPLQMRGGNAKIFKGTCKWYNSQRGFGFIIPVSKYRVCIYMCYTYVRVDIYIYMRIYVCICMYDLSTKLTLSHACAFCVS